MTIPPAYSAPFEPSSLRSVHRVLPPEITAEWAWGGSTGAGVKVAVLDSGIEQSHPAIGEVDSFVDVVRDGDRIVLDTSPHADAYGHGTACAGIIRSIAPDCRLHSVRVLGLGPKGKGEVFAAGLRWAIENGMDVCNLSLGTTKPELFSVLHELADLAYFRNVVLVAAANNMPQPSFPSVYASVISVASHKQADARVFYYNPEPPVEFGAFGIDVRVAWTGGSWITATGNSFASPHIAGFAALIRSKHPEITPFEVKAVLRQLAANAGE